MNCRASGPVWFPFRPRAGPLCVGAAWQQPPGRVALSLLPPRAPAGCSWDRVRAQTAGRGSASKADGLGSVLGLGHLQGREVGTWRKLCVGGGVWAPRLGPTEGQKCESTDSGRGLKPHNGLWDLEQCLNLSVPYLTPVTWF